MEERILAKVEEKTNDITDLLKKLVRIPSLTGEEGAAQAFLAEHLKQMGMDVRMWEPDVEEIFRKFPESAQYPTHWRHDLILAYENRQATYEDLVRSGKTDVLNYRGRPNVVGTLKGSGNGRSLLLTGHVDNVTVEPLSDWRHDPFGAEIIDGRMFGRGTSDMKGGLIAAISAIECLREAGVTLRGDVLFASAVNEEHSGNGTLSMMCRGITADAAIVTEPTENRLFISTPGDLYWQVTLDGVPRSPGARWEGRHLTGVSAIEKLPAVIEALLGVEKTHNAMEPHPLYAGKNPFSCVIGEIAGGTYTTVTANHCTIRGCMYFSPGVGSVNDIMDRIKTHIREVTAEDPWFREHPAHVMFLHHRNHAVTDGNEPIIRTVHDAAKCVNPALPPAGGLLYCTDMEYLVNQGGIPTVVFGPGSIRYAHKADECIEVGDLITCAKSLALSIYRWCN